MLPIVIMGGGVGAGRAGTGRRGRSNGNEGAAGRVGESMPRSRGGGLWIRAGGVLYGDFEACHSGNFSL